MSPVAITNTIACAARQATPSTTSRSTPEGSMTPTAAAMTTADTAGISHAHAARDDELIRRLHTRTIAAVSRTKGPKGTAG